jgi:hypothetical protein
MHLCRLPLLTLLALALCAPAAHAQDWSDPGVPADAPGAAADVPGVPTDLPGVPTGQPGAPPVAPLVPVAPALVHLRDDGTVWASPKVPRVVRRVIAAANRIATLPYRYGGGHGSFTDTGYDCSGSVSYALHGADLLGVTLDSTGLEGWGVKGAGAWITVYANRGHAWMRVAGLRFDTSGQDGTGSRWQPMDRRTSGYVIRHPAGL